MSAVVETKLVITDEAGDVLEVTTTPKSETHVYELRINEMGPVYLDSDDADRLYAFLGEG